ncbi:LacI family DNA-binding transcriptional regulator [Cellulomonas sp. P22]|uniref:LacI family DNA-binding transcriptional regulator n=1 Tax=Cellulomonas sp. P22 TaxID=3373189 RepID=UPI00378B9A11
MSDVAQVAGVSHQTVSRVLNDHPSVRPETRERVLAAIGELGYRRNSAARALVTRRSGTIGVVTTGSMLYGPTSTLVGLEEAARDGGYFVSVATISQFDAGTMHRTLEHFMGQGVEGIVIIAPQVEVMRAVEDFDAPVPVVMISSAAQPEAAHLHTVSVDQLDGARQATRHLIDAGHSEVVHVAGPSDWFDARDRLTGWRAECAARGVVAPAPVEADWTAERGYAVGRAMVREGAPSAVFAANDQLALGLLRAFWEGGLRVPGDVAVVGFDDATGSAYFIPPLTTVRQDFVALGRLTMEALTAALEGRQVTRHTIAAQLVVRSSSRV